MIKMTKIKLFITMSVIGSASLLTGCVGTKSNFDCNTIGGIQGCTTLSDVKGMADQGAFTEKSTGKSVAQMITHEKSADAFLKTSETDTPANGSPVRYGETMQNIWIAPYVAKDGSYMWASMASIIVQPGRWMGEPSPVITNDGER